MTARGDLPVAMVTLEEAMEMAAVAANDYLTSAVLIAAAHVATATGDLDGARRAAEQSVTLVAVAERGHLPAMAGARLAVTLRELGGSAAETEPVVAVAGGWQLPVLPPTWRDLPRGTDARGARGGPARAGDRLRRGGRDRRRRARPPARHRRGRACARRGAAAQGFADAAAALASTSAGAADDAGAPLEAARSRV